MAATVYTIGHSTHAIERFIELLKMHSITAIADVRSTPYSRVNPQYNRETLRDSLKAIGIVYVFLGEELGARSNDPDCYSDGKVQYDRLASTKLFKQGIDRVRKGANEYRVALMCAEKDPNHCHRNILVARSLVEQGIEVRHILANGKAESQDQIEERLLDLLNLSSTDLIDSRDELVRIAYRLQGEAIAYSTGDDSDEHEPSRISRIGQS